MFARFSYGVRDSSTEAGIFGYANAIGITIATIETCLWRSLFVQTMIACEYGGVGRLSGHLRRSCCCCCCCYDAHGHQYMAGISGNVAHVHGRITSVRTGH